MTNLFDKIQDLSLNHEMKSIEQICLKLCEESGECAQAVLSYNDAFGCSYKKLTAEDVKEEAADTILAALSIIYRLNADTNEIFDLLAKKADKWEKNCEG
jgi:NTP pyrophosphatase (non-canonical NTP hydrolase)